MKGLLTLVTIALLVAMAPSAMAQQTATVTGTVADGSGALIPGVGVDATNTNTNITRSGVSGEAGSYTIAALQPGPYRIVASLPGFADSEVQVNLTPNQTYRFDFVMQVAGVATQVEVVSDADALLAATTASVGDALPEYEIASLPLATRDVFDLLSTTAGVVRTEGGDAVQFAGTRNSAVNTTRDGIVASDGRYMDWNGAYAATFTSPDLVEEIQISVGTVDAAAGRGSGQVRLQTRSGTNEFHGALFYATNNSAFNANTWFNNLNGNEPDWTNRQQFGGRLGGPVIEDRMFFFVLMDEQRYRTRQNVTSVIWTEQARNGIFRYFPGAPNENANAGAAASVDASGTPRDWTQIPGATGPLESIDIFDVAAEGILDGGANLIGTRPNDVLRGSGISSNAFLQETLTRMPTPNEFTSGDGLNTAAINWVRPVSGIESAAGTSPNTNRDNLNVRLDYTITDNNKVNFVYTYEKNVSDSNTPSWPGGFYGEATRLPRIMTVGYTSTLSPTIVNEARFGYRVTTWDGRPPYALGCCFGDDGLETLTQEALDIVALFEGTVDYPYAPNWQTLGNTWVTNPGATTARGQSSPLWQWGDTISIVSGAHSFQGGFDITHAASHGWNSGGLEPQVQLGDGNFPITEFDDLATFGGSAYDIDSGDRGLAEQLKNDLSGTVNNISQAFLVNNTSVGFVDRSTTIKQELDFTQIDWGTYFKDTWNVTNDLTLTLGVRWDVYGQPYEPNGLAVIPTDNNFLGVSGPSGMLTTFQPVGKGSPNPDIPVYAQDWNNVAPSFGWSYRVPFLDRPTVVRGGYGISYSGQATFLQYDFGVGRQAGKNFAAGEVPLTFTQVNDPSLTNGGAGIGAGGAGNVSFPLLTIEPDGSLSDPTDPTFSFVAFDTPPEDGRLRSSQTLWAYADDRRIPYIQNFNLSVETEIARDTTLSVAYLGTIGVSLWGGYQANEVDIFALDPNGSGETFLDAFDITRGGGHSAMFDTMLAGLDFGSAGAVGSGGLDPVVVEYSAPGIPVAGEVTGSQALRRWTSTDDQFADGEVASVAERLQESNQVTGSYGGFLRNAAAAGTGSFPENFFKPNTQFNQVDVYDNSDASNYHALQAQVTKRMSSGFSSQFSYTWSKAMGNSVTSTFRARQDQSFGTRDPNNRALQWGIVPFHRTHQINAHGVWNLPFGPGRAFGSGAPSVVARVIEGWTLSGIFGWNSGSPIPVTTGLETLVGEDDANTPNLVGAFPRDLGEVVVDPSGFVTFLEGYTRVQTDLTPFLGGDPDNLLAHDAVYEIQDPSGNTVLANPLPGTTGNLAYNWLTGPTAVQFDAAMEKSIQFQEGREFSLRVDAINLLNTPIWGNPNTNINSSQFGRITSAGGARTFTLNARIDF